MYLPYHLSVLPKQYVQHSPGIQVATQARKYVKIQLGTAFDHSNFEIEIEILYGIQQKEGNKKHYTVNYRAKVLPDHSFVPALPLAIFRFEVPLDTFPFKPSRGVAGNL